MLSLTLHGKLVGANLLTGKRDRIDKGLNYSRSAASMHALRLIRMLSLWLHGKLVGANLLTGKRDQIDKGLNYSHSAVSMHALRLM